MEDSPRFNFFSATFIIGFGTGIFLGVALALGAFALVRDPQPQTTVLAPPTVTPTGTAQPTPADERPVTLTAMDVRLGPGTAFAILGTVARGDRVTVEGRNEDADWIAIQFPPNTSGRGWLPADSLEGLDGVSALAVVAPTPVPNNAQAPSSNGDFGEGSLDATPTIDLSSTPAALLTPSPAPNGTADLAITRLKVQPDGRVIVTVGNRGPGSIVGFPISVIVYDAASRQETLSVPNGSLSVGETVSLETTSFVVDHEEQVFAVVDPSLSINDANRSNNTLSATLSPPPTPLPAGTPD